MKNYFYIFIIFLYFSFSSPIFSLAANSESFFTHNLIQFNNGTGWRSATGNTEIQNSAPFIRATSKIKLQNGLIVDDHAVQIESMINSYCVGMVMPFAHSNARSGRWLLCDGTVYNIASYPTLGAALGLRYGGNGTTTFAVPDYRAYFLRGQDNMRTPQGAANRDPDTATRTLGSPQGFAMQGHTHAFTSVAHSHTITDSGHTHSYSYSGNVFSVSGSNGVAGGDDSLNSGALQVDSTNTNVVLTSASSGTTLGDASTSSGTPAIRVSTDTVPSHLVMAYYIKY